MEENFTNIITNFNSARIEENDEPFIKGIPYIFFTTPFLNLSKDNLQVNSFLSYLLQYESEFLGLLSYGGIASSDGAFTTSPFVKILTNKFKNMDAKDTTSRSKTINETFYGHRQIIPSTYLESINGDEFSITFAENSDLQITKLHKIWLEYIELVRRGDIVPSQSTINGRYIDFYSTVYYFLVDFDGETIKYYSKYTGVAPLTIPYSSFSSTVGESPSPVELNINYVYCYKEDMDPSILFDFNYTSLKTSDLVSPADSETITNVKANAIKSGLDSSINKELNDGDNNYFIATSDQIKNNEKTIDDLWKSYSKKTKAQVVFTKNNNDNEYSFKLKFN